MSLYTQLQAAKSEEDVKLAYIKWLKLDNAKLKGQLNLGLIDIKTDKMWFEGKFKATNPIIMFTQLIYYVRQDYIKGLPLPPFLGVIDQTQSAIMPTERIFALLDNKDIKWGKSASNVLDETVEKVSAHIHNNYVLYNLKDYEQDFLNAIEHAFLTGKMVRQAINANNLRMVFDRWVEEVGKEIQVPESLKGSGINTLKPQDYATFFYADIMSDGKQASYTNLAAQLIFINYTPAFSLNDSIYSLSSTKGYNRFWSIYNRPPAVEERNYLLERRDSLIPIDEKKFKGAFYTPLFLVDKAYEYLNNILGKNWQKDYIMWDPCAGVGNLQVKHSNPRNIYMSTLDYEDINIMQASKTCVGATIFQYDFLNDDIDENGTVNYALTNKIPAQLQELLQHGTIDGVSKKLIILMNPPYAEATNSKTIAGTGSNKTGVAKSKVAKHLMGAYGTSTNELFTQFIARILYATPKATLAMFSTLKYVNAGNFAKFRQQFKAAYKGGFVVHSQAFEGLKGNFPIGFLVWRLGGTKAITTISVDVLTKVGLNIGTHNFYNLPNEQLLNVWITRPRANGQFAIPLKNAVSVYTSGIRVSKWADGAIGYMYLNSNDVQHATQNTFLVSSAYGGGGGMYITPANLLQAATVFTVRRIINHTWLNDRDQFLQPNSPLSKPFTSDCLVYMLFNGSNLSAASNNLQYNGATHSITNHFIPFTEQQVNAPVRFESSFLTDFIEENKIKFTPAANEVMHSALEVYKLYYENTFNNALRTEYHLYSSSVGWYQIRKSLEAAAKEDPALEVTFNKLYGDFKIKYQALVEQLRPTVYDYGFILK